MVRTSPCLFFYGMVICQPGEERRAVFPEFDENLLPRDPNSLWESPEYRLVQRPNPISYIRSSLNSVDDYYFLAIRETVHRESAFTLPLPKAEWDQLLRATCEAHHLLYEVFERPRFYIIHFPEL